MSIRKFIIVWQGQLISTIGSGLTGFALGVWIYQKTRSATLSSMIIFMATLPGILINPLGGLIADRMNRRTVIMLSDLGACLGSLFIAIMIWTNHFELWNVYLGVGFSSLCSGIQSPTYQAAITLLVPKDFYGQAGGMVQIAASAGLLVSPLLAGFLMSSIGLTGIFIIDFITFIYAIVSIIGIKIPLLPKTAEIGEAQATIVTQILSGLRYLKKRTGLLLLAMVLFVTNFLLGFLVALIGPMILSFATPQLLGLGESISGSGMLLGSMGIAILGAPQRLVKWLFSLLFIAGICYGLIGLRANFYTIVIPCFIFFCTFPVINVCVDTLLRKKVLQEIQGRVYALTGMLSQIGVVLAYVVAGPLADRVFEPLFHQNGLLAVTIGKVIGYGPGRGIGFMFIVAGIVLTVVAVLGYCLPQIRKVEVELPDVLNQTDQTQGMLGQVLIKN
jgi:DHA3 family macrolide efflux protein-like MFS transporter